MELHGTMRINDLGHLEIGGCDVVDLARQFGTPLYVLDEALIRSQCQKYRTAFARYYPDGEVIYAGKALLNVAICRIMQEEGMSLDVVSGGELFTALQAGFPPERIYFHGNNKSEAEIREGVTQGVHRFVVDSMHELQLLNQIAAEEGREVGVYLRITPGVEAHTHSYIRTGQRDSKFGFDITDGVALHAAKQALACPNVKLKGFHCHIGSQIFDVEPFRAAVEVMFEFISQVRDATGYTPDELDMGGGMGIRYTDADRPVEPESYVKLLAESVRHEARRHGVPEPRILIEPGRSIVGEAGTTVYTVGSVKDVPGIRTYASVDGGMYENPRVALYQAEYSAVTANRMDHPSTRTVALAGKCCETGDMLIWDLPVPDAFTSGDILAVLSTGAYNYSMASNYNRLPRPAMVLVHNGRADIIVRRESYEDLVRNDLVPERLQNPQTVTEDIG